jgi:uncharacterized protein YecT (DUF1311 family)
MEIVMLRVAALLCTFIAVQKAQSDLSDAYELALSQSTQKETLEMAQQAWFMTGERTRELRLLSYQ